jgi:hypothetical protein
LRDVYAKVADEMDDNLAKFNAALKTEMAKFESIAKK